MFVRYSVSAKSCLYNVLPYNKVPVVVSVSLLIMRSGVGCCVLVIF